MVLCGDGRFTFPALPAGSFTLVASKAGFAKTTFGARSPAEAGQAIRVAGGMGEVYRARDTKLDRDVALKILPEAFASDGLARL